jgi:hypothetical protein
MRLSRRRASSYSTAHGAAAPAPRNTQPEPTKARYSAPPQPNLAMFNPDPLAPPIRS